MPESVAAVRARSSVSGMAERITPAEFRASEGVEGWKVLWAVAFARYHTGDVATGVRLVERIGRLAGTARQPSPRTAA